MSVTLAENSATLTTAHLRDIRTTTLPNGLLVLTERMSHLRFCPKPAISSVSSAKFSPNSARISILPVYRSYNGHMASRRTFFTTDPALAPILDELRPLEPIFHTPEFGLDHADFERRTAPEYWEVGASGRRYSRDFILQMLADSPPVNAKTARWRASGHGLRQLGPDTYLLTYSLRQGERLTRRSTIWERTPQGWRILFHQGTVVTSNEDDVAPPHP